MVDDTDTSMAKGWLNEVILQAEHVEKIDGRWMPTRKAEALWLITSGCAKTTAGRATTGREPSCRRPVSGLGLRSAETFKDIAFAVAEKKTEPQTERIEVNLNKGRGTSRLLQHT